MHEFAKAYGRNLKMALKLTGQFLLLTSVMVITYFPPFIVYMAVTYDGLPVTAPPNGVIAIQFIWSLLWIVGLATFLQGLK